MANQFKPRTRHTKNQSDPQIPQPDLRFATKQHSETTPKRGKAQQKTPNLDLPCDTGNDSTVSLLETCKLIIYCGSSSNVIHVRELSASRNRLDCHASSQKIWQIRSSCIAQLVPIAILIVNVGPVMVSVVGILSLE